MLALLQLLLFTFVVRPLSHLWPKDARLVAFIPREGSRYIDNVGHFHAQLTRLGLLPRGAYLLVTDPQLAESWTARGRTARPYRPFSPSGLLLYLRTSVVIADSWHWARDGRYAFFCGAKKVQVWHGIPLKKIELSNLEGARALGLRRPLKTLQYWAQGRYPCYDLLVSTSQFFRKHAFEPSFRSRRFVDTGYPRNDLLLSEPAEPLSIDSDDPTLQALTDLKAQGKRVVVYAPTFRDTGGGPFEDAVLSYADLHRFARENGLVVVLKLHPYLATSPPTLHWPDLMAYDSAKDAAPLLKLADALVTDYSSIYFDFLLLDRPVVFFPYDFSKYRHHDRSFLFDYDELTPGPKALDRSTLFSTLLTELNAPDPHWRAQRHLLTQKSFTYPDGNASLRLWTEIEALIRRTRR